MTVTNRVKEFETTPSASLTLEQFNTVELDVEADPPVFTTNRIKEVRYLVLIYMTTLIPFFSATN